VTVIVNICMIVVIVEVTIAVVAIVGRVTRVRYVKTKIRPGKGYYINNFFALLVKRLI